MQKNKSRHFDGIYFNNNLGLYFRNKSRKQMYDIYSSNIF